MIGLGDRQALARDIHIAHTDGAKLHLACEMAGIDVRTLQRWKAHDGLVTGDGRPDAARPLSSHALSPDERAHLLRVANEPRFADVPPARIVPMLADEDIYLASESTFSRVLREQCQTQHRGRAKAPRAVRPPTTHIASAIREVWCWDMTYLPTVVLGRWFYLYLILDLYSRTPLPLTEPRRRAKSGARTPMPIRWRRLPTATQKAFTAARWLSASPLSCSPPVAICRLQTWQISRWTGVTPSVSITVVTTSGKSHPTATVWWP